MTLHSLVTLLATYDDLGPTGEQKARREILEWHQRIVLLEEQRDHSDVDEHGRHREIDQFAFEMNQFQMGDQEDHRRQKTSLGCARQRERERTSMRGVRRGQRLQCWKEKFLLRRYPDTSNEPIDRREDRSTATFNGADENDDDVRVGIEK